MTLSDVSLLTRKILLGIVLVIVPFLILWLGIKFSLKLNNENLPVTKSSINITQNK